VQIVCFGGGPEETWERKWDVVEKEASMVYIKEQVTNGSFILFSHEETVQNMHLGFMYPRGEGAGVFINPLPPILG
jgi:hypothetical protein